ncbi:MAG TPA: glycosyltransferase family 4 protein [Gemmatimonadaceae bacterium]|nr:glycosyltransferase family 4 protein [Gemmatimonadaceae bacterium]
MRILFYSEARAWSGSVRAFVAAARGLTARGHQVMFAGPPESAALGRVGASAGAGEALPFRGDGSVVGAALRLRPILARRFVEVVFVDDARAHLVAATAAWLADRAAVVRRVPVGTPPTLSPAGRVALRLATTGFALSSDDEVHGVLCLAPTPLQPVVIPLGVDVERYDDVRAMARAESGVAADTELIVCVADRDSRLRAATVLRAVALLAPRHPELRLAVVGAGSDSQEIRVHAAALRITKRVSFLGGRSDTQALFAAADLGWVVAGGDDGAFGTLDLLASRVPVLAERGTIAQSFVPDGIAGVLLPPDDPPNCAAAMARLLALAEERRAMGNAGRARVLRDFPESAMIQGFERAALAAGNRAQW